MIQAIFLLRQPSSLLPQLTYAAIWQISFGLAGALVTYLTSRVMFHCQQLSPTWMPLIPTTSSRFTFAFLKFDSISAASATGTSSFRMPGSRRIPAFAFWSQLIATYFHCPSYYSKSKLAGSTSRGTHFEWIILYSIWFSLCLRYHVEKARPYASPSFYY